MSVERSALNVERSAPRGAVFLSYASQDADAARRIAESLRGEGVEVWLDQSELAGGDAWDAKIRGQIGECALFVPIISASTQARLEGYFRIEWKLAAQRTHAMAEEKTFLLPVVIDDTRDADAKVPAEFRAVQWTRLPIRQTQGPEAAAGKDDVASAQFVERVKALLGGDLGPRASSPAQSRSPGGTPAVPGKSPRRWLGYAIALLAVAIALAIWLPSRHAVPAASPNPNFKPKTQNRPICRPTNRSLCCRLQTRATTRKKRRFSPTACMKTF